MQLGYFQVMAEPVTAHAGYTAMHFTHRLVSRRMNDVYNSSGRDIPVKAGSVCVHSDTPGAAEIAAELARSLRP